MQLMYAPILIQVLRVIPRFGNAQTSILGMLRLRFRGSFKWRWTLVTYIKAVLF
jgi:hypothetical protein